MSRGKGPHATRCSLKKISAVCERLGSTYVTKLLLVADAELGGQVIYEFSKSYNNASTRLDSSIT
jgi:hypothetical protein